MIMLIKYSATVMDKWIMHSPGLLFIENFGVYVLGIIYSTKWRWMRSHHLTSHQRRWWIMDDTIRISHMTTMPLLQYVLPVWWCNPDVNIFIVPQYVRRSCMFGGWLVYAVVGIERWKMTSNFTLTYIAFRMWIDFFYPIVYMDVGLNWKST